MEEKFKNVLHDDEKILYVTKASKGAIWNALSILVLTVYSIFLIFGSTPFILMASGEFASTTAGAIGLIVIASLLLLFWILYILMMLKYRKNYYIALTDTRIIERKGIININYTSYDIINVSGNITIEQKRTIFDRKNENACSLYMKIELLPVGHNELNIYTAFVENGYELSKIIEKQVKANAKKANKKSIKE